VEEVPGKAVPEQATITQNNSEMKIERIMAASFENR